MVSLVPDGRVRGRRVISVDLPRVSMAAMSLESELQEQVHWYLPWGQRRDCCSTVAASGPWFLFTLLIAAKIQSACRKRRRTAIRTREPVS